MPRKPPKFKYETSFPPIYKDSFPNFAILYPSSKNKRKVRVISYAGNGYWYVLDRDVRRFVSGDSLTFIKDVPNVAETNEKKSPL